MHILFPFYPCTWVVLVAKRFAEYAHCTRLFHLLVVCLLTTGLGTRLAEGKAEVQQKNFFRDRALHCPLRSKKPHPSADYSQKERSAQRATQPG